MKPLSNALPNHQISPPRHLIWSTDTVDLGNPFQRKEYIRQILTNGRAEDIKTLNLDEVAQLLDDLKLPSKIYDLWHTFLEYHDA